MYVPVFERLRSNNISRSVTVSMVCLEAVRLRVSIECINRVYQSSSVFENTN